MGDFLALVRMALWFAGPIDLLNLLGPHQQQKILAGERDKQSAARESSQGRIFGKGRSDRAARRDSQFVGGFQRVSQRAQAHVIGDVSTMKILVIEMRQDSLRPKCLPDLRKLGDDRAFVAILGAQRTDNGRYIDAPRRTLALGLQSIHIGHVHAARSGQLFTELPSIERDRFRGQVVADDESPESSAHHHR